ncbi:hypothetical protein [Lewinella sp. LCG006]|uniref:hypothetical protein n=1 Tax=Lewinella sp. LCG006 TaxID=3231911 RepID=UPI003460D38F
MNKTKLGTISTSAFRTKFDSFHSYKERYKQISGWLPQNIDPIFFAQPRYLQRKETIEWLIETDAEDEIIPYQKLSPDEQERAKKEINNTLAQISQHHATIFGAQHADALENYFEIPSEDFIVARRKSAGSLQVSIFMWGCISRTKGAPSGILRKLIPTGKKTINAKLIIPEIIGDASNQSVDLIVDNQVISSHKTNPNGVVEMGELSKGTSFRLNVEKLGLAKDFICDDRIFYELTLQPEVELKIRTEDLGEQGIEGIKVRYTLTNEQEETGPEQKIATAEDGEYTIKGEWLNQTISARYFFDDAWSEPIALQINQQKESLIFRLPLQREVIVIDKDRKPIPALPLIIVLNGEEIDGITNDEGRIANLALGVGDQLQVKATYQNKKYKSKATDIVKEQYQYEIQLKKNRWLYLLWLLPFLLLLIPVEESVTLEALDNFDKLPIDSALVTLSYYETDQELKPLDTLTNQEGKASFSFGKELLFNKIFSSYPKGNIHLQKQCYQDTILNLTDLSKWRTNKVLMSPFLIDNLDFVVKDSLNGHPVTDAMVEVSISYHGEILRQERLKSNFGGTVSLTNVPLCSQIKLAASKAFHTKDSIGWIEIGDIAQDLEDRTLYLNSLLEEQVFYVKSSSNQLGLPGTLVEAHIEAGNDVLDTIRTVASQDGKVIFPIPDTGRVFMRGRLLGYHDSTYLAPITLIKNPRSPDDITLWLRPKTQPVRLLILDTLTNAPIGNATANANCSQTPTASGRSNTKGEVYLGGLTIDCQLELSVNHPNYIPKTIRPDLGTLLADSVLVIYLRPIPPAGPPPFDCVSGSDGRTAQKEPAVVQNYYMGKASGQFVFTYNTYSAPDKIQIFSNNKEIWSFEGGTGSLFSNGERTETISFNSPYIKVVVTGSTAWDYTVFCPE